MWTRSPVSCGTPARGPGGRSRVDERAALEGILFVLHTGCRWRDLPPQLGYGSGHSAWRRLRAWQQQAGVRDRLHQLVLGELAENQLIDWSDKGSSGARAVLGELVGDDDVIE